MKFIVDECVSRSVFNWLNENFDTKYVQDTMLSASDNDILDFAIKENRIIITRDKDFGDMVFRDKKQHLGIVLMRLKIKNPANQVLVLKRVIDAYKSEISGSFVIASDDSIKIIRLTFN